MATQESLQYIGDLDEEQLELIYCRPFDSITKEPLTTVQMMLAFQNDLQDDGEYIGRKLPYKGYKGLFWDTWLYWKLPEEEIIAKWKAYLDTPEGKQVRKQYPEDC